MIAALMGIAADLVVLIMLLALVTVLLPGGTVPCRLADTEDCAARSERFIVVIGRLRRCIGRGWSARSRRGGEGSSAV
jgi:hypothetical protein